MSSIKQSNSFLSRIGNDWKKSLFLLAAVSSIFFIGLGHVHLFDWDEINFAESAREMIESGDYLRVQINYNPFWEKPPFFFWLQVASMKMFGITEFAARFPNAVFGFIYLFTFYFIGKKHYSGRFGLIWALVFAASLLPHIYFKSGIIDPVFNYFIFLSIYFMLRTISRDDLTEKVGKFAFLSGVFSALSVTTKGPVGFLLLGLTLFVFLVIKKFKNFPSLKHIALFLAGFLLIVVSWLSMELYKNGWDILIQFITYQVELFNSGVAGHAQPFYYHFVVVFFGCFPISVFALPQLLRSKNREPNELRKWMLTLFWVVIILFSIVTTKIIHYSSMTYAPLSFLAALTIYQLMTKERSFKRGLRIAYISLGSLVGLIMIAIPVLIYNKAKLYPYMTDEFAIACLKYSVVWSGFEIIAGIVFLLFVFTGLYLLKKEKWDLFISTMVVNMSVTLLLVLYLIIPKIESFTQGPAIEFYKSKASEDCYIECFGYKSYAQYYYSKTPPGNSAVSKEDVWLRTGKVDKPVYMISKVTNRFLEEYGNFELIEIKGGFRFYKRIK